MKSTGRLILFAAIISQAFTSGSFAMLQTDTTDKKTPEREVTIGNNLLKISETDSSTNVRVGKRGLSVLESLEGKKSVKLERYEDNDTLYFEDEKSRVNEDGVVNAEAARNEYGSGNQEDNDSYSGDSDHHQNRDNEREDSRDRRGNRRRNFKGHWTGIELGFNNYTASRDNFAMPNDINYMTLHSGKSMNFNLNFAQASIGITRHIGFVFGPGINWSNYRFDGNNNIIKGVNGVVEMFDPGAVVKKSKLSTIYMTMPFLLEIQVPLNGTHMNVAAGPIGAIKLDSHSKIIYETGEKVRSDSDFSLNMLRYGATARVGFSNFQFFGTYYLTPLFQKGKGPGGHDLFPFEVGLALTFHN